MTSASLSGFSSARKWCPRPNSLIVNCGTSRLRISRCLSEEGKSSDGIDLGLVGFSESQQIQGYAPAPGRLCDFRQDVSPEIGRCRVSVDEQNRCATAMFNVMNPEPFDFDELAFKRKIGIHFHDIRLRDRDTAASSKCTGPLFYVEFDTKRLRLGVGVKELDGRTLATYRSAVAHENVARQLIKMVARAEAKGHDILGDKLTRVPPAYADQPGNELLKRKGIFVREETSLPKQIHGPEFVAYCRRWFEPYAPLFDELRAIASERRKASS